MDPQVKALTEMIDELEGKLEAEFARQRAKLNFGLERGRVVFEQEILRRHRELRIGLVRYVLGARPLVVLTSPVIYSVIVPLVVSVVYPSAETVMS